MNENETLSAKAGLLIEALDLSEATFDDTGVLRNVVMIRAGMSLNKRRYSEALLQRSAAVFEGSKAYNDHSKNHKATDITGWYSNVRYDSGRLLADRHFAPTQAGKDIQALAQEIVAKRAPATLAGLSINAAGRVKPMADGSGFEVESIDSAESVDDVATAAAGGSYLAAGIDAVTEALFRGMDYEEFLEARPDYVERLRKDFKRTRQDDALKSADAETQRVQGELAETQQQLEQSITERDQAFVERDEAQRALAVERVVNDPNAQLPADWKVALREDLQAANPEQWNGILEQKRKLAASAGFKPRVEVRDADQQVYEATPSRNVSVIPAPNESLDAWMHRIAQQAPSHR